MIYNSDSNICNTSRFTRSVYNILFVPILRGNEFERKKTEKLVVRTSKASLPERTLQEKEISFSRK